jgi:FlaA1/EpsC-like NDP-sugar epimerase
MKYFCTGGVGSIGSEIVSYLISKKAKVKVYDNNEFRIFECHNKYPNVEYVVGDVRDRDKLEMEMKGCDIVIHAAALKHVFLCYENSIEAVKTNIIGTQNVIDSAIKNNVKKVLYISTDKAVEPISIMGATKFIGERLIISANKEKVDVFFGKSKIAMLGTRFSVVRFGNVEGTSGSVIPIFENQIIEGGPVTVTHPEMTRFMMHPKDAIRLIFKALEMMKGGEIFVLKMKDIKIMDLAKKMVKEGQYLPHRGKTWEIPIKITGMKPGEKIHEELMTAEEKLKAKETKDMWII